MYDIISRILSFLIGEKPNLGHNNDGETGKFNDKYYSNYRNINAKISDFCCKICFKE